MGASFDGSLKCCQQEHPTISLPVSQNITLTAPDEDENPPTDDELLLILASLHEENQASTDVSDSDESMSSECAIEDTPAATSSIMTSTAVQIPSFTYNVDDIPLDLKIFPTPVLQKMFDSVVVHLDEFWFSVKSQPTSSSLCAVYSKFHIFMTTVFQNEIHSMVGDISQDDYMKCVELATKVRMFFLEMKSKKDVMQTESTGEFEVKKDEHGVLRYLSGRCVALSKRSYSSYAKEHAGKKKRVKSVQKILKKLEYISHLRTSLDHASRGALGYSCQETEKRQNLGGGLCHVTDKTFLFYLTLELERRKLHTLNHVKEHKSKILYHTIEQLKQSEDVQDRFYDMFS
jgi:hypothetical protein